MNPKLRLLVAIASYGVGHLRYLKQIIQSYQSMDMDVDVVVLSEAPKELGPQIEVVVGLPTNNPWTLPFAHKAIFAQRVDQYDLFVYSEDDIGVKESQIHAFLSATAQLEPDEIAGFLRYEVNESGKWLLTEPWGHYHWKPESVRRRGVYTIAEFTNEHAGFYILTQEQLKRAIASGGFLRGPCRGRYDWPETAATDPYTNCGFHKVICISALDNFLVHHMPNRYANELPVSLALFKEQIQTLTAIYEGTHPASTLCEVESKFWPRWQKSYYEKPSEELLRMIPNGTRSILSIGCGSGATELRLKARGTEVTAAPLDSVIGNLAAHRGITVVYGSLEECFKTLDGRKFDCVLMTNLLHLQMNPRQIVEKCARLVQGGGTLVLSGPNFDRIPWLVKRIFRIGHFSKLRNFGQSGFSMCGPRVLTSPIKSAGLRVAAVRWINHEINQRFLLVNRARLGSLTARDWILQARQ